MMDAVQAQVDAFNARDLNRFLAVYAPDVVIEDGAGNVVMAGYDGMRAMYGPLFDGSPHLHVEIVTRVVVGDYVIDEERVTGFHFPGYPTELHAAVIYHLIGGRIARVRMLM